MLKKTICIMDAQMYSVIGGGQIVVKSLINYLHNEYNIIYIGENDEFSNLTNIKSIKPLKPFFYKMHLNKMHKIAKAIEKICFKFPIIANIIIKKIDIKADIIISNSISDYLVIKVNKRIAYNSAVIVKHHPYYEFNQKYPNYIIKNKKYFILVESITEKRHQNKSYGKNVEVIYPPVKIKKRLCIKNVSNNLIEKTKNKKVILSIGRLSENQKRFSKAILSVNELVKFENKFIYIIVGNGPDKEKYQKLIDKLNLNNYVLLAGFINEDEKNFLLKKSKLLLITSDRETFGLTMAEALGFGVPVISTKTDGAKDFIKNGRNGFLVNPDEKEISDKIKFLLNLDNKKYKKMQNFAKKSFYKVNPHNFVKNMKNILNIL